MQVWAFAKSRQLLLPTPRISTPGKILGLPVSLAMPAPPTALECRDSYRSIQVFPLVYWDPFVIQSLLLGEQSSKRDVESGTLFMGSRSHSAN